jgi:diadenosine tetraphosphate (Ap4A) HIT family hydrolase
MDYSNLIFETNNFIVEARSAPFVSREEGGHIRILPKDTARLSDRTDLTPKEAIEFIRLSMIVGEALQKAMNERGVPVVKINYEDLGNWAFKEAKRPIFHLHIFGRAKNAKKQIFPEAVSLPDRSTGFYDGFKPLNKEDIALIKKYIQQLFKKKKFADSAWSLKKD